MIGWKQRVGRGFCCGGVWGRGRDDLQTKLGVYVKSLDYVIDYFEFNVLPEGFERLPV